MEHNETQVQEKCETFMNRAYEYFGRTATETKGDEILFFKGRFGLETFEDKDLFHIFSIMAALLKLTGNGTEVLVTMLTMITEEMDMRNADRKPFGVFLENAMKKALKEKTVFKSIDTCEVFEKAAFSTNEKE